MWYGIEQMLYIQTAFLLFEVFKSEVETSHNSTTESIHQNVRACPEGNLLLFVETNECYARQSKGPCGENMMIYPATVNEKTGECDCDQSSSRMLLYNKKSNQCFPIFQRGPCKLGSWADITTEGKPICKPNPCHNRTFPSLDAEKDLVIVNGTCVELGDRLFCKKPGHVIGFEAGKRLPRCIRQRSRAIAPPTTRCSPGTFRAISGRCQPAFEFD
ncbi:unnamed protein product [Orchesella dallaii]|uniref:DUF4789 domain-containing protein n=1 Tax=Orchesella dallaii TaxID=48710 RepID=A0ABP1Q269_9HEXA